jgi:hypothetical protein
MRGDVIAQDVEVPLRGSNLEVTVIGRQPPAGDLGHLDPARAKAESSRRLVSAMACVALDVHYRERGRFA